MQGHSPRFADAVRRNHDAIARVRTLDENGRVYRVLPIHDGTVTSNRTQAQRTTVTVDVTDPTGELTPENMDDELTPGTRMIVERGVRHPVVDMRSKVCNSVESWTPIASGTLMSVTVDETGALTLFGGG